jgi:hypothetical protein
MRLIKIEPRENGAHENQTLSISLSFVPEGIAIIPDDMELPSTFPFVNIVVEDGVVTEMTANQEAYDAAMNAPKPEPVKEPTTDDILNTLLGV